MHITALAQHGADNALVERETAALIANWVDRLGSIDAIGLLRDHLDAIAANEAARRTPSAC